MSGVVIANDSTGAKPTSEAPAVSGAAITAAVAIIPASVILVTNGTAPPIISPASPKNALGVFPTYPSLVKAYASSLFLFA